MSEEIVDNNEQNNNSNDQIVTQVVEDEMRKSFLDYAMSVIVSRALPDVRDGLKPVHRRILFAMNEVGLQSTKHFRKSATVVGEVLGKYHPHGDVAVYDSMVRMAQSWALRYPLINGQGNFGSIDGDNQAAMRYTEAKMQKISDELLSDIKKETIDWDDNFDARLKEPSVLPSKIPNLLVNGSTGIAVGMATNIPPHNLTDVCTAITETIENPEIEVADLIKIVQGPDFPTGGTICGRSGIYNAYTTGHGKIRLKAKTHMEETKTREQIVVDEIPYMVNKSALIEEMANQVKLGKVEGISDIRDESDREIPIRIVIELKKDATAEVVLNQILKHTRLSTTFGVNNLVLVDGTPRVLDLKATINYFIKHRVEVITRRTQFDLNKAKAREHILDGLMIALSDIDNVVKLIRASNSVEDAKKGLMDNFSLSEKQSAAILDMKLQKLTSLETNKVKDELEELKKLIEELTTLLNSKEMILDVVKTETNEMKEKYGDGRRTDIIDVEDDIDVEDLIEPEDVVVTISHAGYVKRMPLSLYKEQNRGGKGITATGTRDEDFVENIFTSNTHDYLLVFTNKGKVHWLKVYQIPEGSRQAKGKPIINLIKLDEGEKLATTFTVKGFGDGYLMFSTQNGLVKKTALNDYSRPRAGGINAINLNVGDELVNVRHTSGDDEIVIATKSGRAVRFNEKDVRCMGRTATGVRGVKLGENDALIGMEIAKPNTDVLTITENGYGKRTPVDDYRLIKRGGSGVINIKCSERNGGVVAISCVTQDDSLMLISKDGIMIRTGVEKISQIGRNTQGVRIMRLNASDKVISLAKVVDNDDEKSNEEPAQEN